jgi:hypothetical protein
VQIHARSSFGKSSTTGEDPPQRAALERVGDVGGGDDADQPTTIEDANVSVAAGSLAEASHGDQTLQIAAVVDHWDRPHVTGQRAMEHELLDAHITVDRAWFPGHYVAHTHTIQQLLQLTLLLGPGGGGR